MRLLTAAEYATSGAPGVGRVALAPELVTVELILDAGGAPTGDLIVGAWARDNTREYVRVSAPE